VKTFSIGFKDSPDYDETAHARVVAERFKTDHTEFIVEPAAFDLIEELVWHHDGPFGDSSAVPTHIVSHLTRKHVTVVLTGDGGDEVFAGYLRFYAAQAGSAIPGPLRSMMGAITRAVGSGESARHWSARLNRFAKSANFPLEERLTHLTSQFYDDLEEMLAPDFRRSVGAIDRLGHLAPFREEMSGRSSLSKLLQINFNTYLRDDLLVKTDRCTMANALEARSPFLDTALVEYVAGLPDAMKMVRGRTKIVLREAFQDLVPHSIQRRGKMGFGVPFGVWFRGALREAVDEMLLARSARYQEYLSADYVRRLVARHHSGEGDYGLQLWAILSFEIWLRSLPSWTVQPAAAAART
jgi:asparagine synthase (glutamine-hydrolysing)